MRHIRLLIFLVVVVLVLAACGGDGAANTTSSIVAPTTSTRATTTTVTSTTTTTTTIPPTTITSTIPPTRSDGTLYSSGLDLAAAMNDAFDDICPEPTRDDTPSDEEIVEYLGFQEFVSCRSRLIEAVVIIESSHSRAFASTWMTWFGCGIGGGERINYLYGPNWFVLLSEDWDEWQLTMFAEGVGGNANSVRCSEFFERLGEAFGDPEEPPPSDATHDSLRFVLGES